MSTSPLGAPAPPLGAPAPPLGAAASRSGLVALATQADSAAERVEDRYKPIATIGQGGMGRVEVALERSTDGRRGYERIVALKRLLPTAMKDKRRTEMFLQEARLAALLAHRNVVHAFSFGELDGELYLAMEYVEGEPLSRVVRVACDKDGQLDPLLVAYILSEICDGLHAAHELRDNGVALNVVHRDVSPHNVMVSYDGYVKLLDFGVAKIDVEGLTKTGEVKGKVAYMSPEQAMGDPLDRRSDLYSIGACLFECLAGKKLWEGTDMEVLRHLALDEPPLLEEVVPDAPRELGDIYRRLVARDPRDRPATALHVAQALRKFIASRGARPDTSMLHELMQRHFATDAQRRREELSTALYEVAPSRVSELRRSISPESVPSPSFAPTSGTADAPTPPRRAGSWAIAALLGVAIVGTGSGVWYMKGRAANATEGASSSGASGSGASSNGASGSGASSGADLRDDAPNASPDAPPVSAAPPDGPAPHASRGAVAPGVHRTSTIQIDTRSAPAARPRKDPRGGTTNDRATRPKTGASSKTVDVDPNPI
jgi:eukaryotic-like serine/threonine-protein kinase